ncbi:SusD/RagB family nutrient-binding outer membrane lipoprotein [Ekhidna sp.]|uniref:SusD/RagB family nutrient-binding outer membrane lipoprotein n=1 Tax=Ekhidna sp. TaxID=2608089 RepID=UPI003B5912D3
MKYLYKKLFVLFMVGIFATSCEDYLDVNESPNAASNSEPGPIFNNVMVGIATNRSNDIGSSGAAAQLWSGGGSFGAGVFTNPERYNFSIFTTGNTWRSWYRDAQKDLLLASTNAEILGQTNAVAQCKIMSALVYWYTTVLWEDVPYSEAVDIDVATGAINNRNPNFDSQADVLQGVIDIIDEALALIDEGSPALAIQAEDLMFSGNMENWRKFAKSIKFRTLMTLVDAEPARASEIQAMITDNDMISSASENAEFPFFGEPGNQNPFYTVLEAFAGGSNFFYFASEVMVDRMLATNDPRIDVYFDPYPGGGSPATPAGAPAGVTSIPFSPWVLSTGGSGTNNLIRPDKPEILFTVQEQLFLEAEAHAMGYASGGLAVADEKLRAGITAAMAEHGLTGSAVSTFLDNEIPDLATLTDIQARSIIGEQYWLDCNQARWIEGWTEWRRIESPALNVPDGALTTNLLRRLPYPPDELAANVNAPDGDPPLDERMYFDVD